MGLRQGMRKLDLLLDGSLEKVPDLATKEGRDRDVEQLRAQARQAKLLAAARVKRLDQMGDAAAARWGRGGGFGPMMGYAINRPLAVLLIATVVTLIIGVGAVRIQTEMRGDLEIYLPPGHETTETLEEVREDFSTDVVVLYIESTDRNGDGLPENITDREFLLEVSAVEGDQLTQGLADPYRGLDWNRDDGGEVDGITFVFSLSSLVKSINVTSCNFQAAVAKELRAPEPTPVCGYSLPDQETIDRIVTQVPAEQLRSMVADQYGHTDAEGNVVPDGEWDTLVVLIGVHRDQKPAKLVPHIDEVIGRDSEGNLTRVEALVQSGQRGPGDGPASTFMVNTGPYTVIQKIQGRTILEFLEITPFLILFICAALVFFHRNWRIVPVCLFPVVLALIATLGILGFLNLLLPEVFIISPQVSMMVPVILTLGVAYGLYIANQYSDEKGRSPRLRLIKAVRVMHGALLLSAIAASLGFGALMVGTLRPIFTIGFALTLGIMLVYVYVMITVPALIMWVKFRKHWDPAAWRSLAPLPSNHRKKIVAAMVALSLFSVIYMTPQVSFDADFLQMMPQDDPSIIYLARYSDVFGGGQLGMVLVRADPYNLDTLDRMDIVQGEPGGGGLNGVPNTKTLSIVDIMKTIKTPDTAPVPGTPVQFPVPGNTSFWELVHSAALVGQDDRLLRIFYGTLTPELRGMLVNSNSFPSKNEASLALIFVFMPTMDIVDTKVSVDGVNAVVRSKGIGLVSPLTGVAPITLAVNDLIVESHFISLTLSILLTVGLLSWVFRKRSPMWGPLTILPTVLVIALEPLILVGVNIPLSLITVMIGSIAIGTGVDYCIQISQRLALTGLTLERIIDAVQNLGISFLEATVTVVAGFMAVLISPRFRFADGTMALVGFGINIQSIQDFVKMVMILLTLNAIAALFVLPAIYTMVYNWKRSQEARVRRPLDDDEGLAAPAAIVD